MTRRFQLSLRTLVALTAMVGVSMATWPLLPILVLCLFIGSWIVALVSWRAVDYT